MDFHHCTTTMGQIRFQGINLSDARIVTYSREKKRITLPASFRACFEEAESAKRTRENSPAIYRWDRVRTSETSPQSGRPKRRIIMPHSYVSNLVHYVFSTKGR